MQQLNIIVRTELKSNEIIFDADTSSYSLINRDAKRSFTDQQKWYFKIKIYLFYSFLCLNIISIFKISKLL